MLLTWPIQDPSPRAGLDDSWRVGLHLAAQQGLDAGGDLVFTYGPLGFLGQPLLVGWTGWLSVLYTLSVHALLIGTIFVLARRSFGTLTALAFAFAAGYLNHFESAETVPIIVFLWAVAFLTDRSPLSGRALAAAGGAVAALQVLVKFNTGVIVGGIVVILLIGLGGRFWRDIEVMTGTFCTTFILLWLASGNVLADLGRYAADAVELSSGYASAMAEEVWWRAFEYPLAFVSLSALVVILRRASTEGGRRSIATGSLVLFFLYIEVRHGFVRHDALHSVPYFFLVAIVPIGFRWPDPYGRRFAGGFVAASLVLVPFLAEPIRGLAADRYVGGPGRALEQARLMLSPGLRSERLTDARRRILNDLTISPAVLGFLRGHTVHVDPTEISVIWAADLMWRPPPVFQAYSAYTPTLDSRNADFLRDRGPERILRESGSRLDGRYQLFESPAYVFAMLCNYTEIHAEGEWQVLARVQDRCGRPYAIEEARAAPGEAISIPRAGPDELVIAHVRFEEPPARRIANTLFKAFPMAQVELDGERFRFVEATSDPLVLCVPARVRYSPKWLGLGCVGELSFQFVGGYDITFYAVPISNPS